MRGRALTVRPFLLLLTSEMKYADVILPLPLENSYTYSIPTDLEAAVTPGCRVYPLMIGSPNFHFKFTGTSI